MDAYNFYLSTFRYIMNAVPHEKTTWCDIFKYLPCLRQMVSCSVCGNILLRPHGPTHGVCLHHVCQGCLGGRMRLKPTCSWCKDHEHFKENKKLRVLILCFKRLCAYVLHTNLGAEISKASVNGYGSEADKTIRILEEADRFQDDYEFTPPPAEIPNVSKSAAGGIKSSNGNSTMPASSYTGNNQESNDPANATSPAQPFKRKRGRPRTKPRLPIIAVPPKTTVSQHAKKLKKRALTAQAKNTAKKNFLKSLAVPRVGRKPKSLQDNTGLLISQRPHRDRSGKSSVGQLWRETFVEEIPSESYPDSGIEVGNSSDHDHYSQPPLLTKLVDSEKVQPSSQPDIFCKETRHHKYFDNPSKETNGKDVNSSNTTGDVQGQPPLSLMDSKRKYHVSRPGPSQKSANKMRNVTLASRKSSALRTGLSNSKFRKGSKAGSTRSANQRTDICKCARFKQPNQLTCFGQKCPCYSERRACVDCFCNGCKNPLKVSDVAPLLMHVIKDGDALDSSLDRSMPRLSPIPKI